MNIFFFFFFLAAVILFYDAAIFLMMRRAKTKRLRHPATGVLKGAESVFLQGDSAAAVLCLHGYIGSPTDFEALPQEIQRAGFTVAVPLLPGHGSDPSVFSKVSAEDLEAFVCAEYDRLRREYKEVIVIGFSMGAALAVLLASQRPLTRVILLAPYFEIAGGRKYMLPLEWYVRALVGIVPYLYRPLAFKQLNDQSRVNQIVDYDYISLKGTLAAMRLAKKACLHVSKLPPRTLIMHSRGDKATDFYTAQKISQRCDFTFKAFEKSNHMLLWDYDAREARRSILDFLTAES